MDLIYENIFKFDEVNKELALSKQIDEFGYGSANALLNLGSSFIFLALELSFFFFWILIYILSCIFTSLNNIERYLRFKLFCIPIMRFLIEQYPNLLLSSLIAINSPTPKGHTPSGDAASIFISRMLIIWLISLPFFGLFMILFKPNLTVRRFSPLLVTEAPRPLIPALSVTFELFKFMIAIVALLQARDSYGLQLAVL
jgi:hypothetical protein